MILLASCTTEMDSQFSKTESCLNMDKSTRSDSPYTTLYFSNIEDFNFAVQTLASLTLSDE